MTDSPVTKLPPRVKDITGQKFGRLTAVCFVRWHYFPTSKRKPVWRLKCECGKFTEVISINLVTGHTKSCGCWEAESRSLVHTKHGDAKKGKIHPLYIVWCGMKQRCEDPNYKWFERWGGRGIKILWHSYDEFKRDMLPTYKPGLEIERVDNDGPYSNENCKWATNQEQALNTRRNVRLTLNGETLSISVWAKRLGVNRGTLERRVKAGWNDVETLTTPVAGRVRMISIGGETLSLDAWLKRAGIKRATFYWRLDQGWNEERALTIPALR